MRTYPVADFKSASQTQRESIISHIEFIATDSLLVFFQNEARVFVASYFSYTIAKHTMCRVEFDVVNDTSIREVTLGVFP